MPDSEGMSHAAFSPCRSVAHTVTPPLLRARAVGPPLAVRIQYRVRKPFGVQFVLPDAGGFSTRPPREQAGNARSLNPLCPPR